MLTQFMDELPVTRPWLLNEIRVIIHINEQVVSNVAYRWILTNKRLSDPGPWWADCTSH